MVQTNQVQGEQKQTRGSKRRVACRNVPWVFFLLKQETDLAPGTSTVVPPLDTEIAHTLIGVFKARASKTRCWWFFGAKIEPSWHQNRIQKGSYVKTA